MSNIANATISFDLPTHWLHGHGYAQKAGALLKARGVQNPIVLTDALLVNLGVLEPVFKSLKDAGFDYYLCDKITSEPTVRFFDDLVKDLDLSRFDSVVAVGGGSVIDFAKAMAVVAKFGGSIRNYAGKDMMPAPPDWINISIPTTAGTGSEVSDGAVFIDEERKSKFIMMSKKVSATIALTDPEMTKTAPPSVTAYSGVDALVHATESYLSRNANIVSEQFSLKAIELIGQYLPKAYTNGNNMEARNAMQMGSVMAMIAGCNVYLGLCHSIAMPLCGLYHMPHGQACGMSLPWVLRYNAAAVPQKVKQVLITMQLWDDTLPEAEAFEKGYRNVEAFLNNLGIITQLAHFGFTEKDADGIAKSTLESIQCPPNPREPTHKEIVDLLNSFA